jgi:hypothetical protein
MAIMPPPRQSKLEARRINTRLELVYRARHALNGATNERFIASWERTHVVTLVMTHADFGVSYDMKVLLFSINNFGKLNYSSMIY